MKKILAGFIFLFLSGIVSAQTIADTASLRAKINQWIVPNGAITATKLNTILGATVGLLTPGASGGASSDTTSISNRIDGKLSLSGGTMTGDIILGDPDDDNGNTIGSNFINTTKLGIYTNTNNTALTAFSNYGNHAIIGGANGVKVTNSGRTLMGNIADDNSNQLQVKGSGFFTSQLAAKNVIADSAIYCDGIISGATILGDISSGKGIFYNNANTIPLQGVNASNDEDNNAVGIYGSSIWSQGVSGESINSSGVVGVSEQATGINGTSTYGQGGIFESAYSTALYANSTEGAHAKFGNNFNVFNSNNVAIGTSVDNGDKLRVIGDISATSFKKTGGTSTQFLKADGSSDANTYLLNTAIVDSTEKLYTGTIVWAGTTSPSGITNHRYRWTRTGKLVTLYVKLSYATAGVGNTSVTITMPDAAPAVADVNGITGLSELLYPGSGSFRATNTITTATATECWIRNGATVAANREIYIINQSTAAVRLWATIQYFTN